MLLRLIVICSLLALPTAFEARNWTVSNPPLDVIWAKFDEYGGISSKKEKFRLKNFVIQLRGWKTSAAFIVAHAGRRSCKGEAQARADRVKKYLIESGGIEANRISTIDAGYREEWTIELYLAPREAPPLTLEIIKWSHSGLRPDQVQILGHCKREFRESL
jgi:hypothetical protein